MKFNINKTKLVTMFVLGVVFISLISIIGYSQEIRLVYSSATKPESSDYPAQIKTAELGNKGITGSTITVISPGGSQAAMAALFANEVDVAAVVGPSAYEYVHHKGAWENKSNPNNVRVLHLRDVCDNPIAVRADTDIYEVSDLSGKKVFLGFPGTSCQANAKLAIVDALGINVNEFVGSLSDGVAAMKDRRIVAYIKTTAGKKVDATHIDITTSIPIRFIGFTEEQVKKIQSDFPWLLYRELPKGWFPNMPDQESIIANTFPRFVMCRDDFPEEYAYNWTKSVIENWEQLVAIAPSQGAVNPLECPSYISEIDQVYLHPGAIRYYRERGIEIPDSVIPPEMK